MGMFDYLQLHGYVWLPTITWERNLLHIARKPFRCLELSAINIHFMRFAYGQIHFVATSPWLLYIRKLLMELRYFSTTITTELRCLCNNLMTDLLQTYYIWQWVVNTQVTSLLWRDLELSGFTMPLLGNLHSYALHSFSQDSMNSPTIVLTL